jgi:NAD(P)-dependent dehydrogenase (short-subunit alcohol dehydrogenase family)
MPEGAAALAKQVRAIVGQRLDIFVANAGVSKAVAIEEHTIEDFDILFATNVRSPRAVEQRAAEQILMQYARLKSS